MSSSLPQYDPKGLLDSQPVIVTVIDPATYQVQFQNETSLKKFGDITKSPCYEKIASCSAPCSFCKMPEALATNQMTANEVPLPDGGYLLVQWSKTVTAKGESHVIETITDISAQKRLEEALRTNQKMEAISRLAGGMAHEFNNLLTVINGYCELLLQEKGSDARGTALQHIARAGANAAALTKKLLAFSGRPFAHTQDVRINQRIRDLTADLGSLIGDQIELTTELHAGSDEVHMDPARLDQVLLNLVLNARDAMPNGGTITIETVNVELDEAFCRVHREIRPGRYLRISVGDTGCGMDAYTLSHLFEPFFSSKGLPSGGGLGLAVVYGIVRQAAGAITVSSQLGQGSEFQVYLPVKSS